MTWIGPFCPMRCARLIACSSHIGFQLALKERWLSALLCESFDIKLWALRDALQDHDMCGNGQIQAHSTTLLVQQEHRHVLVLLKGIQSIFSPLERHTSHQGSA